MENPHTKKSSWNVSAGLLRLEYNNNTIGIYVRSIFGIYLIQAEIWQTLGQLSDPRGVRRIFGGGVPRGGEGVPKGGGGCRDPPKKLTIQTSARLS